MSTDEAIKKIQEFQPLIRKVSYLYGHTSDEANDMFQEICIQAWRAYPQFKGDSKFSTWLYRVAINTCISWIRKEKKHKLSYSDDEKLFGMHDDTPFYVEEERKEQISSLYRAIKKLSEIDRTLVLLYLEDVAYSEISEILGLTINNIKVKMNRVKKRLKKLMEDDE